MSYQTLSKVLTAASANSIVTSQSGTANVGLTIASGTLDTQRRVLITSAGNDSNKTFRITGTNESGTVVTEALTGGNIAAVASAFDYLTVTSIVPSANTASTVTVGTNTTGSTPWKNLNVHMAPFSVDFETVISGTVTYSVEYTLSPFHVPTNSPLNLSYPINVKTTTISAATAAAAGQLTYPVRGWRLTVTSGTGTVTAEATQAGIIN